MPVKRRQNLAETAGDHITKRNDGQKNFQKVKVHFTMLMKVVRMVRVVMKKINSSSYWGVFANSCYNIVTPILLKKLINDFAVCKHQKHCSRTLLLAEDVSHSFGNQNYIFQKRTTLFNRSTQSMLHFYVMLHKVYNFTLIS